MKSKIQNTLWNLVSFIPHWLLKCKVGSGFDFFKSEFKAEMGGGSKHLQTTNCKLIWMIRDFEFKWTYAQKPVQFFFLPYRNKSRMCTWTYISGKSNLLCNLHYADPLQSCVLKSAVWALGDNFNNILEIPAFTMLLNWQRILVWNWGTFLIFISGTKLEKLGTLIK